MRAMRGCVLAAAAAGLLGGACGGGDAEPVTVSERPASSAPSTKRAGEAGRAPVIERLSLDPESVHPGEQIAARVSASDPDGDDVRLVYRWRVGGRSVGETGPFLLVEGAERGDEIVLTVVARAADGESAPRSVKASVANAVPRVEGVVFDPEDEVSSDRDLTAQPVGVDDDGDTLEYRYRWSVNGRELDERGPTLRAERLRRGDSVVLRVVASDGIDESEAFETEPIRIGNAAPAITSAPGPLGEDGVFRYHVTAEDPDGDTGFSFRLLEAPDGMTIGADDGRLEWRPGADLEGRHAVEVEVADVYGGRGSQTFELELSYAEDETSPAAPAEPES